MIRTAPPALADARALVDGSLRSALARLCPASRLVAGYHFGWHDAEENPLPGGGGKALRPALALLSAQAAGGPADAGMPGATAVELVHDFSILHDDVIDGDEYRRHQVTAWRQFGSPRAILAGDALLNLAGQVLLEARTPFRAEALIALTGAVSELVRGQQADLSFEHRFDVSMEECLDMCQAKTGALLSCAAAIGVILVEGNGARSAGLASFGLHLGLAFQAVDDLLGTWGEPASTGKPVGNDLRQRKKTLPVVFALGRGGAGSEQLRTILSRPSLGDVEVAAARLLLEDSGAQDWVGDLADDELAQAVEALEALPIPDGVRSDLEEIARFVATRDG
ncbi:MAG TPA: polyprenyl synthetase family protein [Actinomycetota bacterium]|nr:polyprenyl synthetase family protein [Actinomycetota bacterium]